MKKYEYEVELNKIFRKYITILSKYGVSIPQMANMQNAIDNGKYKITVIEEKFEKTKSGKWSSNPYKTNTEEIDVEYYLNVISSIPMFKDKVKYKCTKYGKIPYKLTCTSWGDGTVKSIRTFRFETIL